MRQMVRRILPLGGFLALIYVMWRQGSALPWQTLLTRPYPSFFALGCFVIPVFLGFGGWWMLVNRQSPLLTAQPAYRLFGLSWISRYLPGGQVWQYVSLGSQSQSPTIAVAAISAYFFSTALGLMAGFLLCVTLLENLWRPPLAVAIQIGGAFIFVLGFAAITYKPLLRLFIEKTRRWVDSLKDLSPLSPWLASIVLLANLASWVAQAAGAYALWTLVHVSGEPQPFTFFLVCYAVSFVGAYFTFLTPSGMGLRESAFAVLLATRIPPAEATFVALATGIGLLIGEFVFMLPIIFGLRPKEELHESRHP